MTYSEKNAVHDKQIFLVVDVSILSDMQYSYILVGSIETPHVSYLYNCLSLPCAPNGYSIAQVVDDAVRSLGIKHSFCFLWSC